MRTVRERPLILLTALLVGVLLVSLTVGRYPMSLPEIFSALKASVTGVELTDRQDEILFLLKDIRLPRILASVLVGAALASSGAVYQAMFINPIVSPSILGVLAGASFGATLGIVVVQSWVATQALAFVFACVAVGVAVLLSSMFSRSSILVLVLGGVVSTAFFRALSMLMEYMADPTSQLPEIVYWIMGSFAHVNNDTLIKVGILLFIGIIVLCTRGKMMNVMSLGDEEAQSLGISVKKVRLFMIVLATFVSAATVTIAGTIEWVGLVIPHVIRFMIGPDNRYLLPAAALGGGVYMLFTDTLVRTVFSAEVPIGVATSLMLLPLFAFSLYKHSGVWR